MNIRLADAKDAFALSALLTELGYADTALFIERRLAQPIVEETERLLITGQGNTVLGFLSLCFIPQLALAGDFARISYFCIAEGERSRGAGQQLLQYAESLATGRGCNRMEIHCHQRRDKANAFYLREGYSESSRYHTKELN